MTVYSDREISIHDGQPIECYEFIGTYKTYRYTSSDVAITLGGNVYTPYAIKRSKAKAGTHDQDNVQLQLDCPISLTLIKDYGFQITPPSITMNLYRFHRGTDPAVDYVTFWTGPISTITISDNTATITVPSVFAQVMAGAVPSVYYQTPCNHVLFDSGCKVSRGSNMVATTVQAISGDSVQIGSAGGFPDGFFKGGEVADTSHNDRRMIIAHASNLLQVNYPFSNLQVGASVEVTAGCDHAFNGHCKTRFNNQINHGGFPFIPAINPFTEGL